MSSSTAVEIPVVYVRWEVKKPDVNKSIDSSEFRFQNSEWYLHFSYNCFPVPVCTYRLQLLIKGGDGPSSFVASVHVEDAETRRILPQMSVKTCLNANLSYMPIWSKSPDVVNRLPGIDRNYGKLRFLVVLKKNEVLTDVDSRETQTEWECSVPETVGEARSTASVSVQTSLLHDAAPCLEMLSEDLSRLMVQGSYPDMEFQCAGQTTKGHKSIVCSRSPVLASMLATDMVEGRTGVVTIPDIEPDIFQKFLRYLYSGRVEELTFDTALALYGVGDQYGVHGLARKCSDFLMQHLSVENACELLAVADAHEDTKIVEKVIEYILENKIPLVSECWSQFCDDHPKLSMRVLTHFYKLSMNGDGN